MKQAGASLSWCLVVLVDGRSGTGVGSLHLLVPDHFDVLLLRPGVRGLRSPPIGARRFHGPSWIRHLVVINHGLT